MKAIFFPRNFKALISRLEIPNDSLHETTVSHQETTAKIARRTVGNILNGREPHERTKQILVKIVNSLRPDLKKPISVEALESVDFQLDHFAPDTPSLGSTRKFNVDALIQTINAIVETSKTRNELISRFLGISLEDAKLQFWQKIRELVAAMGIENQAFNEALNRCGMPRLALGQMTIDYAKHILEHPKQLSPDQTLIWRVAVKVYSPDKHMSDPDLKAPARYLAKFWDRSIRFTHERWDFSIADDFGRRLPRERTQVYLLSWLELPLVLQTGNIEPGKIGLFELGRWFEGHRSTH